MLDLAAALPFAPSCTRWLAWKATRDPSSKTLCAMTKVPVSASCTRTPPSAPAPAAMKWRTASVRPVASVDAPHAGRAGSTGALT